MKILVPQGIGDSIWCLFKAQSLAKRHDNKIDIKIGVWHVNEMEARARDFISKFSFVNSVDLYVMPRERNDGPMLLPGPPADANGHYRYIPDGPNNGKYRGIDYAMLPNAPLEKGIPLDQWLPELETNWNIMDDFQWTNKEIDFAKAFAKEHGEYVIFFMASEGSNTNSGHNRNAYWTPDEWLDLGEKIHEKYGTKIVVVGTTWDEDYYNNQIAPRVADKPYWINAISKWPIGITYAVCKSSRFVVSYQSGIGIVSHYLNVPLAIFWRPKGDSISPNSYVSFEESMASAWTNPEIVKRGRFMPCIYGKHKGSDILNFAEANNW